MPLRWPRSGLAGEKGIWGHFLTQKSRASSGIFGV
jgi:hypothetical protein